MQTKVISQRDQAILKLSNLIQELESLKNNIEYAIASGDQNKFDENLATLCVKINELTKSFDTREENREKSRKITEQAKKDKQRDYQRELAKNGDYRKPESIVVLTIHDILEKFNYERMKSFIQKQNFNKEKDKEALDKFIEQELKRIFREHKTELLDGVTMKEIIDNVMEEYLVGNFRLESYEPTKAYAETILNIVNKNQLSGDMIWSAGTMRLLLQNYSHKDIFYYCSLINKEKKHAYFKKEILPMLVDEDLETRIIKYKILQIWSMNKEADELFQKITADNPGYIAKDLLRDYLKGKRDPDSFSLEELEEIQEAFALPYIQMLLSFEPEVFQEKSEKLFAVLEAERNFAESGGTDFHKQLAQGFLETNRALEFFPLEELQQIKNVLLQPQLAILAKYEPEILQTKIKAIDAVLETERIFQEAGSLERAIFQKVDAVELPERKYYEYHSAIFRTSAYENNQPYVIHVDQLNSKNPLAKFTQKIQTEYSDKDTMIVEFFCGRHTIKAMLDLRSMEMVIVNASEVGFSSKDVEREITNLLCDLLPELANKKTYPELNRDDSEKNLKKLFKNSGQSAYIRDLTWREYIAGEFPNVIIEGMTDDELKKSNPFTEEYFLLVSEENKVATVKPLFGIKTLEKLDSLKDVVVLRYYNAALRRQNPGKDAVDRYIASRLRIKSQTVDEVAIQHYKDDVIFGIINDENLRLKNNEEFVLTKSIRIKNENGDLLLEYAHEEMNFVRGYVRWFRVDASAK